MLFAPRLRDVELKRKDRDEIQVLGSTMNAGALLRHMVVCCMRCYKKQLPRVMYKNVFYDIRNVWVISTTIELTGRLSYFS